MSYRTRIEGVQIFGNNDYFEEYIEFLKSSGVAIDEDAHYDGTITDVMGLFTVIDSITRKLIAEQHEKVEKGIKAWDESPAREMTDFSNSIWLDDETPLLKFNMRVIDDTYAFLPYQVYAAVKDKIESSSELYADGDMLWSGCSYKIKDGQSIHVYAG